jgi:guanylate kinase
MRGNLFVVVAPSGAGKTSLVAALMREEPNIRLSISHTTRAPRQGEADGREYHFVERAAFEKMISEDEFLEHADVYGNYYGTSRKWIEEQLEGDHDVLLEIDWQGARHLHPAPLARGASQAPPGAGQGQSRGHRAAHGERPRRNLPCS